MAGRSRHLFLSLINYTRFCIHFTHDFVLVLHIILYSLRTWFVYIYSLYSLNWHTCYTWCESFYTWFVNVLHMMWIPFAHDWHTCYTWCEFFLHMIGTRVTHDVNSFCTWLAHVLRIMWIHFTHDWYTCYTWCEFLLHMIGTRVTHDVNSFYTWLAHMLHMRWILFTHDWHTCYA
jgi:hypothetical protein